MSDTVTTNHECVWRPTGYGRTFRHYRCQLCNAVRRVDYPSVPAGSRTEEPMSDTIRTELRIVTAANKTFSLPAHGVALDYEATVKIRDAMYPALAPHRIERRTITESPWVPVSGEAGHESDTTEDTRR